MVGTNWKDKITRIDDLHLPDGSLIQMLMEITEYKYVVCTIGTDGGYEFSDEEIQTFPNKKDAVMYMDNEKRDAEKTYAIAMKENKEGVASCCSCGKVVDIDTMNNNTCEGCNSDRAEITG